jgi:hypothetical protein
MKIENAEGESVKGPKLTPCPDCGKEISKRVLACANCGRRVNFGPVMFSAFLWAANAIGLIACEASFARTAMGKAEAIALVREHSTFTAMLERTGAIKLKENESVADNQMLCDHATGSGSTYGPVKFQVYRGRRIAFSDRGEKVFAGAYAGFRQSLFEERKRQRPEASSDNSW